MIYDDLVSHIRTKLDPLAEEIAELLLDRIEAQIAGVLEVAKSALVSEIDSAGDRAQPPDEAPAQERAPRPKPQRKPAKERPVIARSLPTPEPITSTLPNPFSRTPHNKGGRMVCTVCHEPGHNARRHKGETKAVVVADSTEDEDEHHTRHEAPTPVPFISRRDRFAAIEQSAAKRTGTLPSPSSSFDLRGGG